MANIIFGPGSSYSGGAALDVPGSPPLQVSAGSVSAIAIQVNRAIQSFYPFSSVQYGVSPYTYSVSSGTLPTGITLDTTTGLVSGTPTVIQATSDVTFSVTDSVGEISLITDTVAFTINGAITATANSVAPVQAVQNGTITNVAPFASVAGGTLPYYYFVSSGRLPDRVTLDPTTGLVSGTPTELYSTANVTFSVRDAGGIVAATTSTVSFTVNPVLVGTPSTTSVSGYQNSTITSFNAFASVTGGYTPYVYSVSSGTLPTGINFNTSTSLVSGTPTATYTSADVTFTVTDNKGNTANTTVNFTVNAALTATAGATTTVSVQQNTTITSFDPFSNVTGGFTPYTYFVSAGTLPPGISLNPSTGLVSGTPTVVQGAASVTFRVRDVNNVTAATTSTVSFTVTSGAYTVNYLVVAGGGGGASGDKSGYGMGGGGGAGGMLASSFTANPGTSYTINVGGGGAGTSPTTSPPGANSGSAGIPGFSSNIFQGATPVVTTTGGGGGGFATTDGPGAGGPGAIGGAGGGGGGGLRPPGGTGGAGGVATSSPGPGVTGPQGFPGGSGSASPQPNPTNAAGGGGGGGKGGAGTTAVTPTSRAGPGGAGAIWPFTGPTLYAGGGGGAGTANAPQSLAGSGGSGIGGAGGVGPAGGAGFPGTNATGSGGGGGAGTNTGGPGGSGVIKFAIPNAAYPTVSAPGATVTNPPAAPGQTVLTYTAASPLTPSTFTYIA
jgi:hypothetical protein